MPTTYWDRYLNLFHTGQPWSGNAHAILASLIYLLLPTAGSWVRFSRTDIAT